MIALVAALVSTPAESKNVPVDARVKVILGSKAGIAAKLNDSDGRPPLAMSGRPTRPMFWPSTVRPQSLQGAGQA